MTMRIWDQGEVVARYTKTNGPEAANGRFGVNIPPEQLKLNFDNQLLVYDVQATWPDKGTSYIAKGLIKTEPFRPAQ